MMQAHGSRAYIIEVHSRSAGVVVRQGDRFYFHAATHHFNALHGRFFKTPQHAQQAAVRHAATRASVHRDASASA